MIAQPSAKYPAFAPIRLKDRTWPDNVIDKAPAGYHRIYAMATKL
ncbi:hypothetical protein BMY_0765 [Wohlfahrtiimonas chitiniclastica]|nr:hypothetical protein BMY_0765 [Wohlfahrtiimonas chitiniclastica]